MARLSEAERQDIYERCVRVWGVEAQVKMAIEEMSELTQALCKMWREGNEEDGVERRRAIQGEVADVLNMAMQMREIYGAEEVDRIRDEKLVRCRRRLDEDEGKTRGGLAECGREGVGLRAGGASGGNDDERKEIVR